MLAACGNPDVLAVDKGLNSAGLNSAAKNEPCCCCVHSCDALDCGGDVPEDGMLSVSASKCDEDVGSLQLCVGRPDVVAAAVFPCAEDEEGSACC